MCANIVLSTLNAKFIHPSLGLRYLKANLGELESQSILLEFNPEIQISDVLERILLENPKIVGFGVYLWNLGKTREIVSHLKKINSAIKVILGGPEVLSFSEQSTDPLYRLSDYIIQGEGEVVFRNLCHELSGALTPNESKFTKIISAPSLDLEAIASPYSLYTDHDLRHRMIYVEASRGCPYRCEFCLSSLENKVRKFELSPLLGEMEMLINRGGRKFKFVDRTFNLEVDRAVKIMCFFREKLSPHSSESAFVHFEMVPDRLPQRLLEEIRRFPKGLLKLEIGLQSWNPEVIQRINRKQETALAEENLVLLRNTTQADLHVDLIAGLPGEDLVSFEQGFNRLLKLNPQEIQVGILKCLSGTSLPRHNDEWGMVYSETPPYEILQNKLISYSLFQKIKRFARFWEIFYNEGHFMKTLSLVWSESKEGAFSEFMKFSQWVFEREGKTYQLSLETRSRLLHDYLVDHKNHPSSKIIEGLRADLGDIPGRKFLVRIARTT